MTMLERFEHYLVEEDYRPGDRLPGELELAERFGVSRGTIREIIIHLTLLGVLERAPRRGTVVAVPPAEAIGRTLAFQLRWLGCGREELKAARLMIETAMIPELIRCITPAQADRIGALIDEMEGSAADPENADRLDLAFHLALFEITGSRILQVFAQVLTLLFDREHRKPYLVPAAVQRSVDSHREMLRAVLGHDEVRMRALIEEHIRPL